MDYKYLGKRIREERILNKMTQANLAEVAGISANFLGQIERGEKTPSLETVVKISNGLNVTVDSLISDITTLDDKLITSELLLTLSKINIKERSILLSVIKCFSHKYHKRNHYELIESNVEEDLFIVNNYNGMREPKGLIITDSIKQELEKIHVKDVEYLSVHSINSKTNIIINNLWKINTKCLVCFHFKIDPDRIPDDFDIYSDCKTLKRIFVSERVKNIFLKNGLTDYKYIKLKKNNY